MSDPGLTSEQRAAIAVHNATQNRMCLNLSGNGQICVACSEVADQIDAAVLVAEQAAEERGRRSGVEEAIGIADKYDSGAAHLIADQLRAALAPRAQASDGPPCAECKHERFWHQWSSKEHAFCCAPVGSDYCGCKNYLAPRDSGKEDQR